MTKQRENKPPRSMGRPKGSKNKATKALREAILSAFNTAGGEDYLLSVAREDPRTFLALVGKVIPAEVENKVSGAVQLIVETGVPRD